MNVRLLKMIQFLFKVIGALSPYIAGKIAFYLFCKVRLTTLRPSENKVMDKADRHEMNLNGKKVIYYDWNSTGKPVLLIHGWESRASRYHKFIDRLIKKGYRPVSFDAPGHGESQGNTTTILEIYEIIKQLQEVYGEFEGVVAHSFGVLCAFYAIKNGVACKKLVAVSGVSDFRYLVDKFSDVLKLNKKTEKELSKRVEKLFKNTSEIWELFSAHIDPERVSSDILVIHDGYDNIVDFEQAELITGAFSPKSNLIRTESLGHRKILSDSYVIEETIKHIDKAS